jgi:hypothetical protein
MECIDFINESQWDIDPLYVQFQCALEFFVLILLVRQECRKQPSIECRKRAVIAVIPTLIFSTVVKS